MDNVHADARFPSLRAGDPSATGSLHYGSRQQQQEQQQQHEAQAKRHLSNNQAAAPPPPPLPDLCLFPALGGSCPWLMPALVFGGGFVASIVLSCCFIIFCMIPVHRRRRRSSLLLAAKEDSSPDAPFPDAGGSHRGTVGEPWVRLARACVCPTGFSLACHRGGSAPYCSQSATKWPSVSP